MATLTKKQIKSVDDFIKKLPSSIVRGNYEKWFAESREDGRITEDEMNKFVSMASNLPVEFQSFPQELNHQVNSSSEPMDIPEPVKEKTIVKSEKTEEPKKDEAKIQKTEDKRILAANKEANDSKKEDKKIVQKTAVFKEAPKKK